MTDKRQTRPLVREGAPHGRDSNFQTWVETVKYGHESYGTRTQKWLGWRGPVAIANDTRPLVKEGAPNQQTRNCHTIIKIWS
jgi:hypothetical protein